MTGKNDEFKPIQFVKNIDGKDVERTAHTPSDEVQFRFDGWTEVGAKKATAAKADPAK